MNVLENLIARARSNKQRIVQHHKKWDIKYVGLSLKDM